MVYYKFEELQNDVDLLNKSQNEERPITEKYNNGKTPMEIFLEK
jgi:hypothetical protein